MLILFASLIGVGGIASFVCWIVLLYRAFRESMSWGFGVLFIPVVGLVFMLLFWVENKRLFLAHLASGLLVGAGCFGFINARALQPIRTPIRTRVTAREPVAAATPVPVTNATPAAAVQPVASATPAPDRETPLTKAIEQKRQELKDLKDSLDSWAKRLIDESKQLKKDPESLRVFKQEKYAGYQAALNDYKSQCEHLKQMEADRLVELKKLKAGAPAQ